MVAGYTTSFMFLVRVLRTGMGLGVAYGIWGALGVVVTAIVSALFFDEAFTALAVAGIGLIILGVVTVQVGAEQAHRSRQPAEAP